MLLGADPIASAPIAASEDAALGDAGDEFRDACRTRLLEHILTAGIAWSFLDLLNTGDDPEVTTPFIDIEFPGGDEAQYTFGAPGSNFYLESGRLTVRVCTGLNAGLSRRNTAEAYAGRLRTLFRNDRFPAGSTTVRIKAAAPLGGGQNEAGLWCEFIDLRYERYVTG